MSHAEIAAPAPAREVSRFLQASFRATAGNLARASTFLPGADRAEGRLAFLACRALDAFEDLTPTTDESRRLLELCAAYLCGRRADPPRLPALAATRESDRAEALVASRLETMRQQIETLPEWRRGRVQSLVSDVAGAMVDLAEARRSRNPSLAPQYGERVLGRIARYALELLGTTCQHPPDAGVLGRAAQAANDLRDWGNDLHPRGPADDRPALGLLLELLEAASGVTGVLGSLRFPLVSRSRAACAYLVATTARFCCDALGVRAVPRLREPRGTAFKAMFFPGAYRRFLDDLEDQVIACALATLATTTGASGSSARAGSLPIVAGRRQGEFEIRLAMGHPAREAAIALSRAIGLTRLATRLRAALPAAPLDGHGETSVAGGAVMLSDYLLGTAVAAVAPLGPTVVQEFADFLAAESEASAGSSLPADSAGELAALLSRTALRARGVTGPAAAAEEQCNRLRAQQLHRRDRGHHAVAAG